MDESRVPGNLVGVRHNATTINGVVINIAAGGQHQVSNSGTVSSTVAKPSRRVRRDASFRLPAFLGGSKRSVNGSSSPASSRRAPSPSSLSSASSSSSPAFIPANNNNNNHAKANLDVHSHPESVRAMQHADYSSSTSSSSSSSNGDLISNTVNVKIQQDQMSETYKSLGDVFGINAAVASIAASTGNVRKAAKISSHQPQPQQHLKSARSVSNVLSHHEPAYQVHRLSTYANVPAPNTSTRFGSSDTRASYNERLSVSRQPSHVQQPPQPQNQRQYSVNSNHNNNNPFPTITNGTSRRSGLMGPPPPPTSRSMVYKSNTSLDLDHEGSHSSEVILPSAQQDYQHLRREYGSQGSINISGNRFVPAPPINTNSYAYREKIYSGPVVEISQSSPGPAASSTLQRKSHHSNGTTSMFVPSREIDKSEDSTLGSVISNGSSTRGDLLNTELSGDHSPKLSKKKNSNSSGFFSKERESNKSQKSLFKKFRGSKESNPDPAQLFGKEIDGSLDRQAVLDDCHRRRFFLHHDIGSMCARLSGVPNQIKLLERKNTTTGASAASAALRNGSGSESLDSKEDGDHGDGISNELVLSCPYFRNEVGGEVDRVVALTRETAAKRFQSGQPMGSTGGSGSNDQMTHTPTIARGFSLVDSTETYWKTGYCPYRIKKNGLTGSANVVERVDQGATFYKKFFFGQDHQNWFGTDENLGPLAISIRREKVPVHPNAAEVFLTPRNLDPDKDFREQFMYRLMVRTSDLVPLRGCVLEESIPALRSEKVKGIPTKEVLEFLCPEIQLSSLHLGIQSGPCEEQLIRLDEAYVQNKYKVGLMYCREGQQTEEDMYNNEEGGPAFNEFLELIGQKVKLKGFNKYKAGLCSKNDSTGLYSVYTEHDNNEVMFHVSTLLPFTPNNRQQLPRKRYIGNDIVTVVFQEPGARPFIPNIKSQFQHVFIVVRVYNPCSENAQYSVAVSRSKSVPMFGPTIPGDGKFTKGKAFVDFLLTKIINAENAAHRSDKFVSMALRTRQELLKDLATNFVTQTTLDSGSKFNLFATKKKDKGRPRFSPDTSGLRGAISWRVVAEDCSTRHEVEAFLGISPDSIVLVQDNLHRDILFLTATKSVIGWTALQNSIRIFFHQGEALILHSKDWETEDMSEISQRLKSVSNGAPTQEFTLRRNQMGQLGFHVQHDGLITEVENFGYAWQTGLRQGSRLVEIIKTPVNALSHEQMVELLKTSMTVTVTVIPPHPDGSPRRGCNLQNCAYFSDDAGDYENVTCSTTAPTTTERPNVVVTKQIESHPQQQTVRSFSPPRSSNSSGYGTGSSRKSIGDPLLAQQKPYFAGQQTTVVYDGGMPSFSSGHSSDEQRWYDEHPISSSENNSPPPLPNRIGSGKNSAFQRVASGSNAGADSPNFATSSSTNSSPSIYQHPPPPRMKIQQNSDSGNPARFNTFEAAGYGKTTANQSNSNRPYSNSPKNLSSNSFQMGAHEEKRSVDARVTYLTEYELMHGKAGEVEMLRSGPEYLQHERLTALKNSSMPPTNKNLESSVEIVSTSGCELHQRMHPVSEDELSAISAGSDSTSPQQARHTRIRQNDLTNVISLVGGGGGSVTPASGQVSRDQSPRIFLPSESSVKMKRPVARHHPNRNSANLGSSTLQEDLLKLIGPDFDPSPRTVSRQNSKSPASDYSSVSILSGNVRNSNSNNNNINSSGMSTNTSVNRKMSLTNDLHLMRSRSRENISASGGGRLSTTLVVPGEDLREYHMARPATVISNTSTTSSPSDSKNVSNLSSGSRKDSSSLIMTPSPLKMNNNVTQMVVGNEFRQTLALPPSTLPLPDAREMDWTSLVDTATKAISVTSGDDNSTTIEDLEDEEIEIAAAPKSKEIPIPGASSKTMVPINGVNTDPAVKVLPKGDVSHLLEKVSLLETRLTSEAREKSTLAEEVAALREENLRLQEESQTAAQQLKKFTDWFFQAIDNA